MPFLRGRDGVEYGYRLSNRITGEVIADRTFETRDEMESALVEDMSPEALLGKLFADFKVDEKD